MQQNSNSVETTKTGIFYGYIIVLAGFFTMAAAGAVSGTFGVFLKPLLEEFGWTRAMTSGAFSAYIWMMTVFGVFGGRLTDRFGPRPVLTSCGILLGLGLFLMSRINSSWQFYLVYGLVLAGAMGAEWVPLLSTVTRWFARRRAVMIALTFSGASLGMIVWPPFATWLISLYDWRNAYMIISLIVLVIVTAAAQLMKRPLSSPEQPSNDDNKATENPKFTGGGLTLRQALHTRGFWLLSSVYACLWFSTNVVFAHIVIYAIDTGIPDIAAARILSISGAASIATRVIMGGIADRIGYKNMLLAGFIILSSGLLLLLAAQELWVLYLFAVIFSFGLAGVVIESPLTAQMFGLKRLGEVLGGVECVSTAFGIISPVLAGFIFDQTGSYQPAFSITAGVAISGMVLTLFMKPDRRKTNPGLA